MTSLYVQDGARLREARPSEIVSAAHQLIARRYRPGTPVLETLERTREFLRLHLGMLDHEVFGILHLDAHRRLICVQDLFRGSIKSAPVFPREVVKAVLERGSCGVILFHNHPSGIADPSAADEVITRRLKDALALIEVPVLDHLIVSESIYSFAEHGRL